MVFVVGLQSAFRSRGLFTTKFHARDGERERERERERWRGREREEGSKSSVDGKELGWGSTVRGRERQRANQRQR